MAVSGNDNAGDGSEANPFATVAAGIAACPDGGVVLVHPGPYTLASEITLARDITIRGETGDPDDVTLTAAAKSRLFTLNHASARLEALTLTGGAPGAGSAKVQNCTVVDNVSELTGYAAGINVEGSATVKNTILWNNVNAADDARAEMGGDASRFDHCFTDDPGLVGKRGREFQLRSNSPCRDAGVVESWMTGALDLYRQPRIDNPKHSVDIGAAECQKTDSTMIIMR